MNYKRFILIGLIGIWAINAPHAAGALTPQERWVQALSHCEDPSQNPHIRVLDSNDRYSYGILQFQMDTWLTYKDLGATRENIYDPEMQTIVALYILNAGGWHNWYNCSVRYIIPRYGLYPRPAVNSE